MSAPEVRFALPGVWWTIPVADEADSKRAIASLVHDVGGHDDGRAALRIAVQESMRTAVARARVVSADRIHVCRELVPGVPVPITLTVAQPPLRLPTSALASASAAETAMRAIVGASPAGTEETVFATDDTVIVRRIRVVTPAADRTMPSSAPDGLEADYWVREPDSTRIHLFSFATAMVGMRNRMCKIFDLVVATAQWRVVERHTIAG